LACPLFAVFAYSVRRIFFAWKILIIPLTLRFAGLPASLHEHELIGDTFLLNGLVCRVAGWAAWTSQTAPPRPAALVAVLCSLRLHRPQQAFSKILLARTPGGASSYLIWSVAGDAVAALGRAWSIYSCRPHRWR